MTTKSLSINEQIDSTSLTLSGEIDWDFAVENVTAPSSIDAESGGGFEVRAAYAQDRINRVIWGGLGEYNAS